MINSGIIVSIQPPPKSIIDNMDYVIDIAMHVSCDAVAIRVEGPERIRNVKRFIKNIPIIGLIKREIPGGRLITPTYEDAKMAFSCGADYIACEYTSRTDNKRIEKLIDERIPIIADVSCFNEAKMAIKDGCSFVTTALSGYINNKPNQFEKPDIELVKKCALYSDTPIIAEGRYWLMDDVIEAHKSGAFAVCVGTAINDPLWITKHYKMAFEEENK